MIYPLLLAAGFVGLLAMALMGFIHAPGHHGHGHGHGHLHEGHHGPHDGLHHGDHGHAHAAGPAHGHAHAGSSSHGHAHAHAHGHAHAPGHSHGSQDNSNADGDADADNLGGSLRGLMWLMPFLSPLNWFSWMLGAGAAGMIAVGLGVLEPWAGVAAAAGALAFRLGVVGPIWNFVFQFASQPAGNLAGCLLQQVEAVTAFNERGEGLIRVNIDGRSEDVLAVLVDGERERGGRIRRGDRLLIEDVEPSTNTCRVSRA